MIEGSVGRFLEGSEGGESIENTHRERGEGRVRETNLRGRVGKGIEGERQRGRER